MHPLLTQACSQADQVISKALGRATPVLTRPSDHADLSSPVPRALGMDGERLAARLELSGTWLESVAVQDGFLNFALRRSWFSAAAAQPPEMVPFPELPPVSADFPAKIHPFDWRFLTALRGREPDPAVAARQDGENPGALVRLTLCRLEEIASRVTEGEQWDRSGRRLLLLLSRFEPEARPKRQAIFLAAAAGEIWEIGPLHLSAPLADFARGVFSQGCAALTKGK